jgi:hypothetical protein
MNYMISALSNNKWYGWIFIVFIAVVWWVWNYRRSVSQKSFYKLVKCSPVPARALILLISPYTTKDKDPKSQANREAEIASVIQSPSDEGFDKIALLQSNLVPQLKAVEYHVKREKLQEIWLLATEKSQQAAALLEVYLKYKYSIKLEIHRNEKPLPEWDYVEIRQEVERIFKKSAFKDEMVIADITGGTKMMSVALAIACIPPGRQMQYMDAERDWQGNPLVKKELSPILIDIDPLLYGSDSGS